jgi:hypothetical protein
MGTGNRKGALLYFPGKRNKLQKTEAFDNEGGHIGPSSLSKADFFANPLNNASFSGGP